MGVIAEGEEREMLGGVPRAGLPLSSTGAGRRVGAERGSSVSPRVALRHVLWWGALCCLLPAGWGCGSTAPGS